MNSSPAPHDPTPSAPRQPRRPAPGYPVVRAMHRSALAAALPVGVLTVVICWVVRGPDGAAAAAIGATIAVLAFVSGTWGVGLLLDHLPGAELAGALGLYLVQLLLLVSAVLLVRAQDWLDPWSAAAGLLATALAHQIGQVTGFLRSRTLLVDTPLPGEPLP